MAGTECMLYNDICREMGLRLYSNKVRKYNMHFSDHYDVIVIGAGHAGIEAALAAARLGLQTILFTINMDAVGNMPCNPAIGGTGKGHLVRELDALGGQMGIAADHCCIQYRMLNRGKGPAVHSLRAQADRRLYQNVMKHTLEMQENLELKQAQITEIVALPGNGGIAADATCVDIGAKDIEKIVEFAAENKIEFAVVAPDDPLVLGAVDALESKGIPCFGPSKNAAIIEGSKVFSKNLMKMAEKQIRTLASPEYLAEKGRNGHFLLKHSVGSYPSNTEVNVPLTYADYYFLEALLRINGKL